MEKTSFPGSFRYKLYRLNKEYLILHHINSYRKQNNWKRYLILLIDGYNLETKSGMKEQMQKNRNSCTLLLGCVCVCTSMRARMHVLMQVQVLSHVQFFVNPQTVVLQAPPTMGFFRREYQNGQPFPPPGDLADPGIKPASPASAELQGDSLSLSHWGSPLLEYKFLKIFLGNNLSKCIAIDTLSYLLYGLLTMELEMETSREFQVFQKLGKE